MVAHMKTTIDIADELLERAKRQARRENKTLKEIVEEALRRQIASAAVQKRFVYRPHTVNGKGLQPGIAEGNWEMIRDLIYKLG
jgi:hypothetical protein